ncbi:hypothetical protein ZIOFF_011326 [Zingiber officinale]|uniref:Uncharacterized protein n=1 Tax=Zingiber officinale TaxID=94328 RepID=A0A8J5I569_ZINOF|nr:hypothetical protein ZIOFF_011326 [Zingiber officinale]
MGDLVMPRLCTRSNPFLLYSSYCHCSIRSPPALLVACPSRISSASGLVVTSEALSPPWVVVCPNVSLTLPCCPNWFSGGHRAAPSDHWVLGLKIHLHVKCEGFRAGLRALIHGGLVVTSEALSPPWVVVCPNGEWMLLNGFSYSLCSNILVAAYQCTGSELDLALLPQLVLWWSWSSPIRSLVRVLGLKIHLYVKCEGFRAGLRALIHAATALPSIIRKLLLRLEEELKPSPFSLRVRREEAPLLLPVIPSFTDSSLPHQALDSFSPHHHLSSSGLGRGKLYTYHRQPPFPLHFRLEVESSFPPLRQPFIVSKQLAPLWQPSIFHLLVRRGEEVTSRQPLHLKGSDDHLVLNIESGSDHSIAAKSDAKGLVKILKKYDKRTRALIRQPFIEKVSQQPFFTTDLLYKLVKECVAMLDHLFPSNNLSISAECDGQNGVPKPA